MASGVAKMVIPHSNFSIYDRSKADNTVDESLTNRHEQRNDPGIVLIGRWCKSPRRYYLR